MKDPAKLMQVASAVVADPSLAPIFENGVFKQSFCNVGAHLIFKGYGGPGFPDDKGAVLHADAIYCFMTDSPKDFHKINVGTVQALASAGSLVFGCMTSKMLGQDAGHICTAIPGLAVQSGHWGTESPNCANIGIENFIGKPMSYAFRHLPDFFVRVPSL